MAVRQEIGRQGGTLEADKSRMRADGGLAAKLLIGLGAVLTVNALALGVTYVLYPGYVDTGEPNIVALAWRMLAGHPVYLPVDDAVRTTNIYGPYLYLVHAVTFALFGAGVAIGKAPAVLALGGAFAFVWLAARRHGTAAAALALALAGGIVVHNLPATVWDRPETFMIFLAALALWLAETARPGAGNWPRAALIGATVGIAMGMKVFAALYFLPAGLLLLLRAGIVPAVTAAAVALGTAILPFALPAFDLGHLLAFAGLLAGKPNSPAELVKILRYLLYYAVPAAVFLAWGWRRMASEERRETLLLLGGTVAALLVVLYPAQKPGAGMYYLLPFLPAFTLLAARGFAATSEAMPSRAGYVALALALVVAVLAVPTERRFLRGLDWTEAKAIAQEIEAIRTDLAPRSIEIGIGDDNDSYRRTYQRTRLVFDGHPYTLDTSIIIETTAWGVQLTEATLDLIRRCATQVWLIPKGERPFDWIGYYGKDTYGPAFRDAFHGAYEKRESRTFFDVYACRRPSS